MAAGELITQAQQIKALHVSDTSKVWLVRLKDTRVAVLKARVATREAFGAEVEICELLAEVTCCFPTVLDVDMEGKQVLLSLCGFISAAQFVETCSDVWEPLTAELLTLSSLRILLQLHTHGVIHGRLEPHHLLLSSKTEAHLSGLGQAHRGRAQSQRREDVRQLGRTLVRVLAENCTVKVEAAWVPSLLRRYTERLGLLLSRMMDKRAHPRLDCEELLAELEGSSVPQPVQIKNSRKRDEGFQMGALTKELEILSSQHPFPEASILKILQQLQQLFQHSCCKFTVKLEGGSKPCEGSCGRTLPDLQQLLCKHCFCEDCLVAQLNIAVQRKVIFSHICCVKCKQTFDPLTLRLPAPLFSALDELQIKQKYRACPKCTRLLETEYSPNPQNLKCLCGHKFCSYCKGGHHYFFCDRFYIDTR